ncbi:MAG: M48 family metallopeptidase [Planctomycetota bacterium]|jgi:STE24 endopeptidase
MEDSSKQSRRYSKLKVRLTILELVLSVVFVGIVLLSGASVRLRDMVGQWSGNFYLQVGLYLAVFAAVCYALFLGFDFYGGYVLEHKFGLSNQTVFGWLKKSGKKGLLSLALLLIAGEVLYFFLRCFSRHWWLPATGAWLALTIVLGRIAPILIIPLFYKCSPLGNKELKERLFALGKHCGVRIREVFEIKLSKETTKANAAVAGWGRSRRILLGDTLVNNYTGDEIEAVFAHELGHVRLHHIWKILAFGAAVCLISFYLTFLLLEVGTRLFAFNGVDDVAAFPLLALILMGVGLALMPIQLAYSRRLEKQADMFAIEHTKSPESFASAMSKLAHQNLVDPSPGRLEEMLLHDHPPISKRMRYIRGEDAQASKPTD